MHKKCGKLYEQFAVFFDFSATCVLQIIGEYCKIKTEKMKELSMDIARQKEIAQTVTAGKAVLGMEFGSTRIKAVLLDEHNRIIAQGHHLWRIKWWTVCGLTARRL